MSLKESPVFEAREDVVDGVAVDKQKLEQVAARDDVLARAIRECKGKAFFEGFFLRFGQAGNSGMIQTYLISYITATLLLAPSIGTNVVIVSSLVGFITVPLIGFLSDLVGRKLMYISMTSISLVLVFPMIAMIATGNINSVYAGHIIMHQTSVLALASLENNTMSELFGSRNRYTQLALAKELAAIIATGIGPVLAAALVVALRGSWIPVAIMIAVFTASSLGAAIVMPEPAGRDLTKFNDAHPGEGVIGPVRQAGTCQARPPDERAGDGRRSLRRQRTLGADRGVGPLRVAARPQRSSEQREAHPPCAVMHGAGTHTVVCSRPIRRQLHWSVIRVDSPPTPSGWCASWGSRARRSDCSATSPTRTG